MMPQTRKIIIICVFVSAVLFAVGFVIGLYAIPDDGETPANPDTAEDGTSDKQYMDVTCPTTNFSEKWETYRDRYIEKAVHDSCSMATCNTEDLPRSYLAYHLNGQAITIDGHLDDPAWEDVPWTEDFMDIRGPAYPEPRFNTKVKVRWDDERLYIGARMEETDFWGNITVDDTGVWTQNEFAVFIVPDGSFHYYKAMHINVLNTTLDYAMKAAYIDYVKTNTSGSADIKTWDSGQEKATYTDGIINNPHGNGTFWTAEWSFSFDNLAEHTLRSSPKPEDDEVWFFSFSRSQYQFNIIDGMYEKDADKPSELWSWQPTYTVNLHIPSRFGLVQFKRDINETKFNFDTWHIYRALIEMFNAEQKYKALNGVYSDDLQSLDMAPKILPLDCVNMTITVANSGTTFEATVTSILDHHLRTGHIKQDRYVWFT